MTIEEAIKHAERVAQANKSANCTECAEEHTQIAEWLTELKQLRADCEKQKEITIKRQKVCSSCCCKALGSYCEWRSSFWIYNKGRLNKKINSK